MTTEAKRTWHAWLGAAVAVAGAASWIFRYADPVSDLWWHLASGREILSRFAIPLTDSFSYTFAGRPWLNHEWLWQVVYWSAYRIDPEVLAWLNVAVIVALFALLYLCADRVSGSAWAAGGALWLVAATLFWFLDVRPHLVTLLFVVGVMLIRDQPWAPLVWPPLVALWANLHGGFVFGIGTIGLLVLVRTAQRSLRLGRLEIRRRELVGVALCLLTWMLNPWGWRLAEYPLAYAHSTAYRTLTEWLPTPFGLDPATFEGRFWIVFALALAGAILGARRHPDLVALAIVTAAMALRSRRFIPLFCVTAAPLVACALVFVLARVGTWLTPARRAWVQRGAFVLAALVAVLLWRDVKVHPHLLQRWTSSHLTPRAAVRYLDRLGPPQRILNQYNWGGYLIFAGDGAKVFIDERANTLYDEAIFLDYLAVARDGTNPELALAGYPAADAMLAPVQSGLARTLTSLSPPWRPIYRDARAVILVPPGSDLLARRHPDPAAVLGDEPDVKVALARQALQRGDLDGAERLIRFAIELDPLMRRNYAELAGLQAQRGDLEAAASTMAAGIRENPRQHKRLRLLESQVWLEAGEVDRALQALGQAVPTGPFVPRQAVLERIEMLEQRSEQK